MIIPKQKIQLSNSFGYLLYTQKESSAMSKNVEKEQQPLPDSSLDAHMFGQTLF